MRTQFSLVKFQEDLVTKLVNIEYHGVGLHRRGSRGKAIREARERLLKRGYSLSDAQYIIQDARDMATLEIQCEEVA
jgi:predicted alpha/beta-fold hydrolase